LSSKGAPYKKEDSLRQPFLGALRCQAPEVRSTFRVRIFHIILSNELKEILMVKTEMLTILLECGIIVNRQEEQKLAYIIDYLYSL